LQPYPSSGSLISTTHAPSMADNDAAKLMAIEASVLQQHISNKLATLEVAEKKATEAHACVRAIVLLQLEEHASTAAQQAEAAADALQLTLLLPPPTCHHPQPLGVTPPPSPHSTCRLARYKIFTPLSRLF
jgi:hypothetical protein